ncbi:MAG TPA: glutamate cyclase domain-containing protein [Chloroflexota bacterium]|nr:glutamate cyclase domain-containing protein [Chloroflexota bacterium]
MTVSDERVRPGTAVAPVPAMAEYVDRLITVEMRNRGMPADKIRHLYDAARADAGAPLAFRAADGLVRAIARHEPVLIVTGAGSGPLIPNGENDGPVGAATLARALQLGLGALPILVCEQHHLGPIVASCHAAGIELRPLEVALATRIGGAAAIAPTEQAEVSSWAHRLFDELDPSAVIAIERLGPNEKGIIHGATGLSDWGPLVDLSPLFEIAAARGVLTVGVGDAGNEIGFGRIVGAVRSIQPYGAACQCPCGAGMATVVSTDVLVVAAVSNWGAYGIEACLAMLLERADLVHDPNDARRIILRCLESGGLEAMHCTRRFYVDGIRGEVSVNVVQMLREMVRIYLEEPDRGAIH